MNSNEDEASSYERGLIAQQDTAKHNSHAPHSQLARVDHWLDIAEDQATKLLEIADGEGQIDKASASELAAKYLTIILRLLDMRMQMTDDAKGQNEIERELVKWVYGKKTRYHIEPVEPDME